LLKDLDATPRARTASIITCSFRGDFETCRLLCESIDRFVPDTIHHRLFVPAHDMRLFGDLASVRRTVAAQESILPRWFFKIPLPGQPWRMLLRLPRRRLYMTPFSLFVRGWIAQQIMKIAATVASPTDIVVHVDSDGAFIRPLSFGHLVRGQRIRLYRSPEKVQLNTHRIWHASAGRLLGLPPSDFYGAEYIDPLVVWSRLVLLGMIQRIEAVTGSDWKVALTRTPHFAEYILYGVYADRWLGLEAAGLFEESQTLCHGRWTDTFEDAAEEAAFVEALRPEHIVCLIQSTIAMSTVERKQTFERVRAFAAHQDRDGVRLSS
jgi:hypothetical protein